MRTARRRRQARSICVVAAKDEALDFYLNKLALKVGQISNLSIAELTVGVLGGTGAWWGGWLRSLTNRGVRIEPVRPNR